MDRAEATVLFAGGGTGGTVGPGIAIAERLLEDRPALDIRFLCSDRSVDRRLLDPDGWTSTATPARSPSIRPRAGLSFLKGWWGTRRIVGRILAENPGRTRVVALGGFVAPPVVAEAVRRRCPVDLVNLDAVAGRANRWVARRATRVFSAVPTDLELDRDPVGVPLRRVALASATVGEARQALGLDRERRTLLVTGASQGARSIDRFIREFLVGGDADWTGWQVLHLAGGEVESLQAAYETAGVPAVVLPFLDRMGLAWAASDLAISRGGASSVAEIAASRTPAIIVPYPWHADRHQARNAAALEGVGAIEVGLDPVTGEEASRALAASLRGLLADPGEIARRREVFPASPEDAAKLLAEAILHGLDPV